MRTNNFPLMGFRLDDTDRSLIESIKLRHELNATNAIRLALRTQAAADGVPGVDPTAFRPPARGNPDHREKKIPLKTPEKTAILKKSKRNRG